MEMRCVYSLARDLELNPRKAELAQKLTLDPARPTMGLKGTCGLFGSEDWWRNVDSGKLAAKRVAGVIVDAYVAGQDLTENINTVDVEGEDGAVRSVGIYVNNPLDVSLFKVGADVEIVYVLDELKSSIDGRAEYLEIALEMFVSVDQKFMAGPARGRPPLKIPLPCLSHSAVSP